ncbi:MAG: hypothetical protein B6D72_15730 [gamma proteobacterium symbiont of Ctena orbiculata]|nr:hypothetical protein [Candidatus Thiodiazotropha taylori]PUB87162.1 MAG: hypothetical protein DBP00_09145 [gamma proteobacterium symbiont of Ctena orbiculata]MBT2995628.1 hypothetical protein [Candidatus Thiodiazotropha taylori]MBT2999418.1 hypothetical protein [Candidatus Thiodiazotropha taylori]MBT3025651.1 hypothetical protein [Candidatus Thiodiazotropha taylori]
MKKSLSHRLSLALPFVSLLSLPLALSADVFTGKLKGYGCASHGITCPTEKLDPHIVLEPDFVLMLANGEYAFLPNLSRDIKVRYVLETIEVNGTKHPKFNAIKVDVLRVKQGDMFVTVWSQAEDDFYHRAMKTVMPGYLGR